MRPINQMNAGELANFVKNYSLETFDVNGVSTKEKIIARLRELHEHQEKINKFIRGEGDINGYYFGETPPGAPPFWWRKHLMTPTPENKP
jgi:hypothetical protein